MEKYLPEYLNDLLEVGKTKSLGYLPLQTIKMCGSSVSDMTDYAEKNGLEHALLEPGTCDIGSGALYLYDEAMLMEMLSENREALEIAGVPCEDAKSYIVFISNGCVCQRKHPMAYKAIAKTFNDERFRGEDTQTA